ncbi:hypothetical protein JKP88DRAFT_296620 [Tribonema minus]|uniref:peptidylprolyl isomerase n=1 Tax=Tribonema minus TaxID=303371 RepID=A0A835ZH12_9STRA|nr:hypothetical protein JKP88DRAFT_296620 [Tribonema minus]
MRLGAAADAPPLPLLKGAVNASAAVAAGGGMRKEFHVEMIKLAGNFNFKIPFVAGAGALGKSAAAFSDEFDVVFDGASVGLQLTGLKYKGSSSSARASRTDCVPLRHTLLRIGDAFGGSAPLNAAPLAAAARRRLRPGLILVSANGRPLEAASARQAADAIRTGARPLTLRFRDASLFNESLEAAAAGDGEGLKQGVSTRVVQAADPRDDQSLAVRTMRRADACRACAGAARGDLLEIRYTARLAATGAVFDASGRGAPGRGGDATFYFVLGEQPRGQFPPGWDLGLLGMCVGEVREVAVPPALGYGARGAPRRGVPGGAALVYEVELVSVNSVALCNAE